MQDPFVNQPPLWTDLFKSILNGIEQAACEHQKVEDQGNFAGLTRVIGGRGQGQGAERQDKPTGAEREPARAPNHHYVFCTHQIPYWRTCGKCGRTKVLAAKNADLVLKHIGGAAFFTK